jgi:polysaccharide biosynthesis transport protein
MSIDVNGALTSNDDNLRESRIGQRLQSRTLNFADSSAKANASRAGGEEGGLDLGRLVKAVQRNLWIVVLANVAMMGAAFTLNRAQPPVYEGSFRILIEPVTAEGQVVSALKGNQATADDQDLGTASNSKIILDYPTQIQILLSDKILLPVVQSLKSAYPKISYSGLKNSLVISRFKEPTETKILEVIYKSASQEETQLVINNVSHAYVQYSLSERQTNVRRALQFVDSQLPKIQTQVRDLESALQGFREKNQLIDPTGLGTQLGTQANNLQQEKTATEIDLAKTRQLYKSLENQLQLQPKDAEAASVLSEAPGYQQLVKQLQEIDVELSVQSAQLTDENPKIVLLQEKRNRLLPLLQEKANTTLGSNLSQSTTNSQSLPYQNALRQDLSKQFITAANQIQVLEAKLNGINVAIQKLSLQTGQLPIISRQYETLQRQLKIATEQLSKFSQKREELMINAARQEIPWELIVSPTVKSISASSLPKDLFLGLLVGCLVGTGIALLLDKINDVIHSVKDLRGEVNFTILGMIPNKSDEQKYLNQANNQAKIDADKKTVALSASNNKSGLKNRYKFSPFIESFRALNSQIRLLSPDTPVRSLVVSSALSDEGKTTVAIHLAQAAAAMGQRVLIVNADLRKVSSSTLLKQENGESPIYGLTDVIVGNVELMDAIKLFPGKENLYVLPPGSTAADPTSLLGSKKMQTLMEDCGHIFDLVIYDSVPLNFADSLLLITQTDGLLMVTRLDKVRREELRTALSTLEISNVPVLGLVVNMVSGAIAHKMEKA